MRKFFLLLSVVLSIALASSAAVAEGGMDPSILTLGLRGAPLPADYEPAGLAQIASSVENGVNLVTSRAAYVQAQALEPLYQMMRAAARAGQTLYVRQAYRSYVEEERRYELMTDMGQATQKPGESSYQKGLSVMLVGEQWRTGELTVEFENSEEARWLSAHAAEFGFALRYPKGKEDDTGWDYEPWHYRYVGVAAATIMAEQGLCLEELAAQNGWSAELPSSIPLPEDEPERPIEDEDGPEAWDDDAWDNEGAWDDEEGWDEEVWDEEEAEPRRERGSDHGVPPVRDPSTIDPDDIGPDGDYEISIDDL